MSQTPNDAILAIREHLLKDVDDAISVFQQEHHINVSSVKASIEFVVHLGHTRSHVCRNILDALKSKLLTMIASLSQQQLNVLLAETFSFISVDSLRSIPLALLARMDRVPQQYMNPLFQSQISDERIPLPSGILKQVMEAYPVLAHQHIHPLVDDFIAKYERVYGLWTMRICEKQSSHDWQLVFGNRSVLQGSYRDEIVSRLSEVIGTSWKLYESVLRHLRTEFKRIGSPIYGVLRMDVWHYFHHRQITQITQADTSGHFISYLKEGIRANDFTNELLANKITKLWLEVPKNHPIVGEWGLAATNPLVHYCVLRNCCRLLHVCVQKRTVPRRQRELTLVLKLWLLGVRAHSNLLEQNYNLPDVPTECYDFLTNLCGEMVLVELITNDAPPIPWSQLVPSLEWVYADFLMGFVVYQWQVLLVPALDACNKYAEGVGVDYAQQEKSAFHLKNVCSHIATLLRLTHQLWDLHVAEWQMPSKCESVISFSHCIRLCVSDVCKTLSVQNEHVFSLLVAVLSEVYVPWFSKISSVHVDCVSLVLMIGSLQNCAPMETFSDEWHHHRDTILQSYDRYSIRHQNEDIAHINAQLANLIQ